MIFKDLKQQMLLPVEEYIINKTVTIRGTKVLLLSFTIEKNRKSLWLMYENNELHDESFDEKYPQELSLKKEDFVTNREEFLHYIMESHIRKNFNIKEMEIQGNTIGFHLWTSSPIHEGSSEEKMHLQHFVEKGLIPEEWDDISLENIVIARYEQIEAEEFPKIDKTKDLSVVLRIDRDIKEVAIQHPFVVKFGKQDVGKKVAYFDETLGKESYFYIDDIYSYDPYEDIIEKSKQIEDPVERENVIKNITKALEVECPKGKNLAIIKYETPDDIQLRFIMKDYLEAKPVHSCSSIGFICRNDEIGINGYKLKECVMQSIDKDFEGELEIELFSKYVVISEETIY
ncbi:hypothetical protein [Lutispora thermophila]|uniref:Uncharacterized protein n=1 Tax=Lutispora thermophila DSM 19022 TaxID=1122184 RepID=A0A1M6BE90_9FIRM|nr:hypothetical protein [Lutispora thermophila]SHI46996.1 hypothetical protein SAMN02745176_00419 [Lutispora thermophila DSM 19022]